MKLFNKQPLDYSLAKQDKYDVVNDDVDDDDPATFRRQSRRWRRLRVNICLFYLTLRSGSGLVGSWWANAPWLQILFEFCWRNFNWQFKNSFFNQQRLDSLSWEAVKVKQQRAQARARAQLWTYRTQAKSRIKPRPHLHTIARAFMRAWLGLVVKNARNLA